MAWPVTLLRFEGQVAVVTGGGTGIGAAHSRLLAQRGAAVVVNDLDAAAARSTVEEINRSGGTAVDHAGDISTEQGAFSLIYAALGEFGCLDIVVNNAGMLRSMPFEEFTADLWDAVIAVNLRGTFLVTHAAWPHLIDRGGGRIVCTTSNSGLLGTPKSSAYATAKAGVWGLTRVLALEGAEHGIGVNAIAPLAYTTMSAQSTVAPESWRTGEGDDWSRRLDVGHVAATMAWLAHQDCTLTGQVLSTAGGRVARFALRVTEGFDREHLTPEDVRDHESELLVDQDVGVEYRTGAEEGRALHHRLIRGKK